MIFDKDLIIANDTDNWDKARWDSYKQYFSETTQLSDNYIDLAHYASFPLVLSSDLVYKIYLNFINMPVDDSGEYPIWQASEFLFSPIIREIGYDLYEIYPNVREALKDKLREKEIVVGLKESIRMVNFMREYVEKCSDKISTEAIREAHKLNYNMEENPIATFYEVLQKIKDSKEKTILKQLGYLLAWGRKIITNTHSSGDINGQNQFVKLGDIITGLKEDNYEKIKEALEGFEINDQVTGLAVPIPTKLFIDLQNQKGIISKPKKRTPRKTKLKIFINHFNGNQAIVENLKNAITERLGDKLSFCDTENRANYTLHIRNNKVYLTNIREIYKPLFAHYDLTDPNLIDTFVNIFKNIWNWFYTRTLKGDLEKSKKPILSYFVFQENSPEKFSSYFPLKGKNDFKIYYDKKNEIWTGSVQISIKNEFSKKLYVYPIYFSYDITISLGKIEFNNLVLLPQETLNIHREFGTLTLKYPKDVMNYNWNKCDEIFKFIISENEIDIDKIKHIRIRPNLPNIITPQNYSNSTSQIETIDEIKIDFDNFYTEELRLQFINPEFNKIKKEDLREMLTNDDTVDFALGNYYDIEKDRLERPIYKLKKDIELL